MTVRRIDLPDEKATRALGAALAGVVGTGDVVALRGGLGAGKTTLCRGLVQALCGETTEVPSPTYTLVQTYDAPAFPIFHFDLYRLEESDEVVELGWDDAAQGLALVEWPEKAGARLPLWRLDLQLGPGQGGREAILEPIGDAWRTRIETFHL